MLENRHSNLFGRLVDLSVIALFSLPPLYWFTRNWMIYPDGNRYLLEGLNLSGGKGYELFGAPAYPLRGPGMAIVIASIIKVVGADLDRVMWGMRLFCLIVPFALYFIVSKVSGRLAGVLAAVMVTFFGLQSVLTMGFTVDSVMMAIYLLSLLSLLWAVDRDSLPLSFLAGLLLGFSIITKETSIVGLPIALLAVLFFGKGLYTLIPYYLGAAIVATPWWVWVYQNTGQIYLVSTGQVAITRFIPELIALGCLSLLAIVIALLLIYRYRTLILQKISSYKTRRIIAWVIAIAWVGVITYMLSSGAVYSYKNLTLAEHIREDIIPFTRLWYLYPVSLLYVLWRLMVKPNPNWDYFSVVLVTWLPAVIVTVFFGFAARQLIAPQVFILGALGCLIADFIYSLPRLKITRFTSKLLWAPGSVIFLIVLASGVAQALEFVTEHRPEVAAPVYVHTYSQQVAKWIRQNVPNGQTVMLMTDRGGNYYIAEVPFHDALHHDWRMVDPVDLQVSSASSLRNLCERFDCSSVFWIEENTTTRNIACDFRLLGTDMVSKRMQELHSTYLVLMLQNETRNTAIWYRKLLESGKFQEIYSVSPKSSDTSFAGFRVFRIIDSASFKRQPIYITSSSLTSLNRCLEDPSIIERFFPQGVEEMK